MARQREQTTRLQSLLDQLNAGDQSAIDGIIEHSQERVRRMASRMLRAKPHVARWHETGDILQASLIRLYRSLKEVTPENTRAFYGLVATQIRRELIDIARSVYGPQGHGRHHKTDRGDDAGRPLNEKVDPATDVFDQIEMIELHERIAELEGESREIFDLLFYQGLTRAESAELLEVSERTITRRWRRARLELHRSMNENRDAVGQR